MGVAFAQTGVIEGDWQENITVMHAEKRAIGSNISKRKEGADGCNK